ncbi:acyltransferase family protein [Amnibacterium flavum]|nr:acyltransferase [Amnibacterium flavum]
MSRPIEGAERDRLSWVDAGRGVSMLLVTVFHVTFVMDGAFGPRVGIWPAIDDALVPLRMPLFFFISGLLAAQAVRKPLDRTRRRTSGLVYLYLLWSAIQVVHLFYSLPGRGASAPDIYDVVASFLFPTGLWYFWALVVFFLVSRLLVVVLRDRSIWALPAIAALAVVSPLVDQATDGIINSEFGAVFFGAACANFVWFYLGLHVRHGALDFVAHATWRKALAASVGYVVLYLVVAALGLATELRWLLSAVVLYAALQLLGLPSYRGRIGRSLAAVGRRTLPVYASQWIALHLLAKLIVEYPSLAPLGPHAVVASIATPVFALAIVALTWWIGGLVLRSPLSWLFDPPQWLVRPRGARSRRDDVSRHTEEGAPKGRS